MLELYAYLHGELVGVFRDTARQTAEFAYIEGYSGPTLSLSLPNDGRELNGSVPYRYLDNLLPDQSLVRQRWAAYRQIPEADVFSLLAEYGEDVAGAVVLSSDPELPHREPTPLEVATEDEIAERVKEIRRDPDAWVSPGRRFKMSLGGAQGKFSLARVGSHWYWSSYHVPSTHIFKPEPQRYRWLAHAEHVGLTLADRIGLEASASEVASVRGMEVFLTKRWDRHNGQRIHAEDLNQVLGNATDDKYEPTAAQIAAKLRAVDLEWEFVRQLSFNVALGNFDAHAKNYSVLYEDDLPHLSPLYDTVPVMIYPQLDHTLAMDVGGTKKPNELVEKRWHQFAHDAGLDPDEVCQEAYAVITRVTEVYEEHMEEAGINPTRLRAVRKYVTNMTKNLPGDL